MRRDCKPLPPPAVPFADLPALIAWHQYFVDVYQKKANRYADTARHASDKRYMVMHQSYTARVQMHQSAVDMLSPFVTVQEAA